MEEDPASRLARTAFGIDYLYPIQRLVIGNVLDALDEREGRSDGLAELPMARQAVILPTGAGKSICFQLPALLAAGISVVVYPLLGLMSDQARRLSERGIQSVILSGGMSPSEREDRFEKLKSGAARLALVNPEILAVPEVLKRLKTLEVSHFVVDEAHCVSEWGDSFRPAYLRLAEAINALKPAMVTAFTATASSSVLAKVAESLFGGEPYRLVMGSPDRPNISYGAIPSLSLRRSFQEAVRRSAKPMLAFASSRDGVAILAEELRHSGAAEGARFYHAGLSREERAAIERWFLSSRDGVLCATCAYGMGMDKPDIRTVIHVGFPASIEAYLQESGRAGRDGGQATSLIVYPYGETHSRVNERKAAMEAYARDARSCRRTRLLNLLGHTDASETPCGGCDVCKGQAGVEAAGLSEIASCVKRYGGSFDVDSLSRHLTGSAMGVAGSVSSGLAYSASLHSWPVHQAREAITEAIRCGMIVEWKRWPWKGRLTLGRSTKHQSSGNSSSASSAAGGSAAMGFLAALFGNARRMRGLAARSSLAHGSATYLRSSQIAMKAASVASVSQRSNTAKARLILPAKSSSDAMRSLGHSVKDSSSQANLEDASEYSSCRKRAAASASAFRNATP